MHIVPMRFPCLGVGVLANDCGAATDGAAVPHCELFSAAQFVGGCTGRGCAIVIPRPRPRSSRSRRLFRTLVDIVPTESPKPAMSEGDGIPCCPLNCLIFHRPHAAHPSLVPL